MLRTWLGCGAAILSLSAFAADNLPPAAKTKIAYARDIEPLLANRCYVCDGPQQQMSGLRLDRKDTALRMIQPGNSAGNVVNKMLT